MLFLIHGELSAQTLRADYRFNNTRSSSVAGAPDLTDLGPGSNGFLSDDVRGTIQPVLHFPQGNGLRIAPTTGVIPSAVYTIAILCKIDAGGYRRLVDFKNGTADAGLYVEDTNHLQFFIFGLNSPTGATTIFPNNYVHVVLTRDGAGIVTGYVNGIQQFQFDDAAAQLAVIDANNALRFFRDNESGGPPTEHAAGSAARMRLYDGALSAAQVAALYPISLLGNAGSTIVSAGSNGALDPGETVTVSLAVQNIGGPGTVCTTSATTGTLQASGGVINPSPASQNYGALCSNGPVVFRDFTFQVDPNLACGAPVIASLALADGIINYGTLSFAFVTGAAASTFSENYDGVLAPVLPSGWVPTNAAGPAPVWVTSTTTPDTASNDAFVDDPPVVSDKRLDTPPIFITTASAQVSFRNSYNLERTFDGGVLEVSSPNIFGGNFTDITDAAVGGSFVAGGYDATISSGFENPLAGRLAWTGVSAGGYITTVANLGPNVAGQTIRLRFRLGSDNAVTRPGWRVDTILVTEERACAPTLLVTTVNDHDDGVCDAVDCTLREAINAANLQNFSTIGFVSGVTGMIQLTGALPSLSTTIGVQGPGANLLTVRRNTGGSYRIFTVLSTAAVMLRGLTISNGQSLDLDGGGGIYNRGNLTLTDCAVAGNTVAAPAGVGGNGGGIFNATGATLTLLRSTFDNNSASQFGGAIYNDATLSATNCTFSNNTALRGGGIISRFAGGASSSTLRNCTIASCTATSTSGGSSDGGGGFYAEGGAEQIHVGNTIIASNTNAINPDVRGQFTSDGHNVIGSEGFGSVGFTHGINGDQVGPNGSPLNPQLGALGNNGGPTQTRALLNGSSAINAGNDLLAPPADQRRYLRAGVSDIGAFEFDGRSPAPPVTRVVSRKVHGATPFDINLSLTGNPGIECRTGGAGGNHQVIVTFASPVSVGGVSVMSGNGMATAIQSASGNVVTMDLAAVANAQTLGLTLLNVSDGTNAGDVVIPMGVLLGDTTGSGLVNGSDISQTKAQSGQPVGAGNFRSDFNTSNSINASDIGQVKAQSGTLLPP